MPLPVSRCKKNINIDEQMPLPVSRCRKMKTLAITRKQMLENDVGKYK
jgi:hypothetical protein